MSDLTSDLNERRVFERLPLKLSVRYIAKPGGKSEFARTQNISAQGLGLIMVRKLRLRTVLEIWMQLLDKEKPFLVKGEVLWQSKIRNRQYLVGIGLEKAGLMVPRVL
jgi:hypothetical protein